MKNVRENEHSTVKYKKQKKRPPCVDSKTNLLEAKETQTILEGNPHLI
jgi:hypothetical protein